MVVSKDNIYISRDEVSSPTIQLESLMITLLIDAHEKLEVATVDVVGAYLLATIEDFVIVKVDGASAHIMCEVNPTFNKYIVKVKGKNTLYQQLTRAL